MTKPKKFPEQEQELPGSEQAMDPQPEIVRSGYTGSDKLKNKVALITGGDSGIGRSVAVHFAIEGASVAIIYKSETEDALDTQKMVEAHGQTCLLIPGDVRDADFCAEAVAQTQSKLGPINILVNNAAVHSQKTMYLKLKKTSSQLPLKPISILIFSLLKL